MPKYKDLDTLMNAGDQAESIIALDEFIDKLCRHGDDIDKLTEPQKVFFYNQTLENEVNNGGFNQYFFNTSGKFAHETAQSLRTVEANKTADLLQSTIAAFPGESVPKDRQKRVALMEEYEESMETDLENLTNRFYEYEEDLASLNLNYVRRNLDSF